MNKVEINGINDILSCLPHRYPIMLVDRVSKMEVGKSIVAIKNVTYNEQFFQGHFPNQPIMPGVLIIEALAQASCILAVKTSKDRNEDTTGIYYFAAIDEARFKRAVVPGDQLTLSIELLKVKSNVWKFSGAATVEGQLACSANLTCFRRDN